MQYNKPLPVITEQNREFWEGTKIKKLRMQRCGSCNHLRYPINHVCPKCLSDQAKWDDLSGKGEILSYIVFHQNYSPSFSGDLPYNVALIQLKEGPRMFSNIVGVNNDVPKVGDKVEITFDLVTEEIAIPRFKLSANYSES